MRVSQIWRGHGSALFVELGQLTPRTRRDGGVAAPEGEIGVMIEWSWRIEKARSILCGSWSDEHLWQAAFDQLIGRDVATIEVFGRVPELCVAFSGDFHLASFMTAAGDPAWTLFDRRVADDCVWIHCQAGSIVRGG